MTNKHHESERTRLIDFVAELRQQHPEQRAKVIALAVDALTDAPPGSLTRIAVAEGVYRVYEEASRRRSGATGLRAAETINRNGEQLAIEWLGMRFSEAHAKVDHKRALALGGLDRADFEAWVLRTAEERCRERGLDPGTVALAVGSFIDEDEVAAMYREWPRSAVAA